MSPAPNSTTSLYVLARKAWLSGNCAKAILLAKRANALKPSSMNWSIIGACSCSLRRRAEAQRAVAQARNEDPDAASHELLRTSLQKLSHV